jgi:Holliday junction resolvase
MATNYQRGRGLEYRAKEMLSQAGWQVIRAASSKGIADLWAYRYGRMLWVSCKLGKGGAPPAERQRLGWVAHVHGATPVVAWQRKPRAPVEWKLVDPYGVFQGLFDIEMPLEGKESGA